MLRRVCADIAVAFGLHVGPNANAMHGRSSPIEHDRAALDTGQVEERRDESRKPISIGLNLHRGGEARRGVAFRRRVAQRAGGDAYRGERAPQVV